MSLTVRVLEKDFAVYTAGTDECWVQCINLIRSHDDLDVATIIKPIQLIQQFQHGSLHLTLAPGCRFVSFGSNGIDFVDEDNGRGVLCGHLEDLSNQSWSITEVFLDQFAADDA